MSDQPVQPTEEEINQFPQAPEAPVVAEDNTEGVSETDTATTSGENVDPTSEGKWAPKS